MWVVVEIGKKQYLVEKNQTYKVERLKEKEKEVFFDKVLLFADDKDVKIGTPYVENLKVKAEILKEAKDKKIIIYKYKRRKKYRRKAGHRQIYTHLKISDIGALRAPHKAAEK